MKDRLVAEFVGTAFLVATVIGTGIMATRLTDDIALQLLTNSLATGAVLVALILSLGGAFNPVVTLVQAFRGEVERAHLLIGAQVLGGAVGAIVANLMFELDAVSWSTTDRSSSGQWLGEVVATLGLVMVVLRTRPEHVAFAVGGYISAAYWFTSSTSFANPAVTLARTLSDTFAGIEPASVPMFLLMQVIGGLLALVIFVPRRSREDSPVRLRS
ncbi:MAG TPA: aquaporin [Nocardioidaceae bacterium]|nr:aquaporin [Nocardioidaceae bacterium]